MIQRRSLAWKWMAVTITLVSLVATTGATSVSQSDDWHVTAEVAESCSCDVSCPCNFGSDPTHDYCHGSRLYEITEGHYRGADVAGLEFMVTFSMNEWAKLYVSHQASDAQMEALERLVPHILGEFESWGILSTQKVPLVVERSKGKLKFSVLESAVDMNVMTGFNGEPVKILNLPWAVLQDYTQYKSVETRHRGGDQEFSYSGTNGFTSKLDTGSKK